MRIDNIVWEKVLVVCRSDDTKTTTLYNVLLTVTSEPSAINLAELAPRDQSLMYAKPKLLHLSPTQASFEAFWWSAQFASDKFDEYIPVKIECYF